MNKNCKKHYKKNKTNSKNLKKASKQSQYQKKEIAISQTLFLKKGQKN